MNMMNNNNIIRKDACDAYGQEDEVQAGRQLGAHGDVWASSGVPSIWPPPSDVARLMRGDLQGGDESCMGRAG